MKNIKLAIRNLLKNSTYTLVNLAGITLALSISVVLFMFAYHHYSYEKGIPNAKNSYRVISRMQNGTFWASTFAALEDALQKQSEIESMTTFYYNQQNVEYTVGDKVFDVERNFYADTDFLNYFSIKLKQGNPSGLDDSNTAMLSQKTAQIMFGKDEALGKVLLISSGNPGNPVKIGYTVVGIVDDISGKSHLGYDVILSKKGAFEEPISQIKRGKFFGAYVYVKSRSDLTKSSLNTQLTSLLDPYLKDAHGPPMKAFDLKFQAVQDIHFTPDINRDFGTPIRKSHLNILLIIGLTIFLTGAFNFLIMNMGQMAFRQRQTQIIQFLGGKRSHVFLSVFREVLIVVIVSCTFALVLISVLSPAIKTLLSTEWNFPFDSFVFWIVLLGLCGFIVLSSTVPTTLNLIKQKFTQKNEANRFGLKKTAPLFIFQFIAVITLIGFTFLVNKQLGYIQDKDLGYNSENIAVIHLPGRRGAEAITLKEIVKSIAGVQSVGIAANYPGYRFQDMNLETEEGNYPYTTARVEMDAINTLGITLKESQKGEASIRIFINETFKNSLAKNFTEDQIENGAFSEKKNLEENMIKFKVEGVVSDFHYNSLYATIGNFAFFVGDPLTFHNRFLLVRINQANSKQIMQKVMQATTTVFPDLIGEPTFLNDQLNAQYLAEKQLLHASNLFSWITIVITCFGLFAFSMAMVQRKTKEIGIRKVNGANITEILAMLNRDFIKWVAIAFVIACPIAYYAMNKWLENFAYKTTLSWWIFALAGVLALGIALLTVSWQSWRAATRNPVEALRYE